MIVIKFTLIVLTAVYLVRTIGFLVGLFRLRPGRNQIPLSVSVIVPARNEEENIASCLESLINQDYPGDSFEVIVVDDASNDKTSRIVREGYPSVRLIKLKGQASKKAALQEGIQASSNEVIFTIDADCIAQKRWLRGMMEHFEQDVGMVAGMILFDRSQEKGIFHRIQSLEFLGLVTAGAGSIGLGEPLIGNGGNLAYRKAVFQQVEGFKGIDHLASGDDDLLMQKVHRLTQWKVRFSPDRGTINYTRPVDDLRSFLNQRVRWASKGIHYQKKSLVVFLTCIYFYYLLLVSSFPLSLLDPSLLTFPLISFFVKSLIDALIALKGCRMAGRLDLLKYFPLAEGFHIAYILYAGLMGLRGGFEWKGRRC